MKWTQVPNPMTTELSLIEYLSKQSHPPYIQEKLKKLFDLPKQWSLGEFAASHPLSCDQWESAEDSCGEELDSILRGTGR